MGGTGSWGGAKGGRHTVPGAEPDINSGVGHTGECELERLGLVTLRFKCLGGGAGAANPLTLQFILLPAECARACCPSYLGETATFSTLGSGRAGRQRAPRSPGLRRVFRQTTAKKPAACPSFFSWLVVTCVPLP